MQKQALTQTWFAPAFILLSVFGFFGAQQYLNWHSAPTPQLTWGCGASAVVPAGVHLPEKAAFNWWLLIAQLVLGLLVVVLAALLAYAVRLVDQVATRYQLQSYFFKRQSTELGVKTKTLASNFVLFNFGMRAPPVGW